MDTSPPPNSDRQQQQQQQRIADILNTLNDLQSAADEYTILKLSEPISSSTTAPDNSDPTTTTPKTATAPRTSDISLSLPTPDTPTDTTPTSLEADLAHYRELFSKLRFSYVEQVTKEKFIRAIVGDPPLIVSPQENADLEARNLQAKGELKRLKVEVSEMVGELRVLRGGAGHGRGEMGLGLGRTREVVEGRREEVGRLEREVEVLGQQQVPRKRKEVERLRAEVVALEKRRANSVAAAREAKRRRENAQGGVGDELEARGRWYRASETVLRQVLDLQG
jgi:type II secretory pathway pseudopilin PulG